jgi:hypothetical protein
MKKSRPSEDADNFVAAVLTRDLSNAQLTKIRMLADIRLGKLRAETKVEVETVPEANRDLNLFYGALADLVLKRVGQRVPHLGTLQRVNNQLFVKMKDCVQTLVEFRKQNAPKLASSADITFFKLFLRLAYDYWRSAGLEVSSYRLCSLANDCGMLIDSAYPGYLESGLLAVVLQGKLP